MAKWVLVSIHRDKSLSYRLHRFKDMWEERKGFSERGEDPSAGEL